MPLAPVQGHHDIRSQNHLDLNGPFRGKKVPGAVNMGLKMHPFIGELGQFCQRKKLESPGVGEHGFVPGRKGVKPFHGFNDFNAGPQI